MISNIVQLNWKKYWYLLARHYKYTNRYIPCRYLCNITWSVDHVKEQIDTHMDTRRVLVHSPVSEAFLFQTHWWTSKWQWQCHKNSLNVCLCVRVVMLFLRKWWPLERELHTHFLSLTESGLSKSSDSELSCGLNVWVCVWVCCFVHLPVLFLISILYIVAL